MSDTTTHRAFFGDAEYAFRLTPALVMELETLSGMGIGALCQNLFAMNFRHADMLATIRLALIGGGTSHEKADHLVRTYAADFPIMNAYPLAVDILDRLWSGPPANQDAPQDEAQGETAPEPEAVPAPPKPFNPHNPSPDDDLSRRLRTGFFG